MKVYKKFAPLTIEVETEEELNLLAEALREWHYKHKNGWHIIGRDAANKIAEQADSMFKAIKGYNV